MRAANTGISAIIDAHGRVISSLPLGVEGVLDSPLPRAVPSPVFARAPLLIPIILWVLVLGLALLGRPWLREHNRHNF